MVTELLPIGGFVTLKIINKNGTVPGNGPVKINFKNARQYADFFKKSYYNRI
jgi:hypothetical protein